MNRAARYLMLVLVGLTFSCNNKENEILIAKEAIEKLKQDNSHIEIWPEIDMIVFYKNRNVGLYFTSLSHGLKNIDALNGLSVNWIEFKDSEFDDISALEGMPLEVLILHGTPIKDLSPLLKMPLVRVDLPEGQEGIEFLKKHKTLAAINNVTVSDFWKEYDASKAKK